MKMLDTSASNQKRVIIRHLRDRGSLDTTYASDQTERDLDNANQ